MSKELEDIRRKFQSRFGNDGDTIFPAVITEVNEEEFTCTARRDGNVDYFDVRLRGLVNPELQGFAFIPKLESTVLVCRIGKSNELFVCLFTEIDKVKFTDNDLELSVDAEFIDIRKGEDITVHIDADKLELTNGKTTVTHEAESLTMVSGQTTVRITTGGLTLKKGGSGLRKTLEGILDGICQLTVPTGVGPSGVPINSAAFQKIKADLPNYMEG